MKDFVYSTPTKVYFGRGAQLKIGEAIKETSVSKIMLQYGKGSIKKSGLYQQVVNAIKAEGIEIVEMGGVEPNPKLSFVRKAIKLAKDTGVELILAVGGGSVIDSCKFTAIGATTDVDVWKFVTGEETPKSALPVGCVLTISAAGSEMSSSAVITNEELNVKKGLTTEFNRCAFAICNPELTFTLPEYQTACGVVDILSHTMERYFTVCPDTPLTDSIAESIMKNVVSAGKKAIEEPNNYDARATLMWASSLSHNGLTGAGRENYLAVHQIEHALSGEFDHVTHGAGLALLFPAWAKYVYDKNLPRFVSFAKNVWGATGKTNREIALNGINAMQEFFKALKMPSSLIDVGVTEKDFLKIANNCTRNGARTIKSYVNLNNEDIISILHLCK